jgi:hypothetical protein
MTFLITVTEHEIATATGFIFVWRCIGQVFGVGLSGAVFQVSLQYQLERRFDSPEVKHFYP